jgi:hypothetical protein
VRIGKPKFGVEWLRTFDPYGDPVLMVFIEATTSDVRYVASEPQISPHETPLLAPSSMDAPAPPEKLMLAAVAAVSNLPCGRDGAADEVLGQTLPKVTGTLLEGREVVVSLIRA